MLGPGQASPPPPEGEAKESPKEGEALELPQICFQPFEPIWAVVKIMVPLWVPQILGKKGP